MAGLMDLMNKPNNVSEEKSILDLKSEPTKYVDLSLEQKETVDNIIFAEAAGGSPDEIAGVASTIYNRIKKNGFDKAVKGYSSYNTNSDQYRKAKNFDFNDYEVNKYIQYSQIAESVNNPDKVLPYTHHENIKEYGEPYWADGEKDYKDIGRQRFYTIGKGSKK